MPKPSHPRASPVATVTSVKPAIAHVRSAPDQTTRIKPLIRHRRLLHPWELGGRLRGKKVQPNCPGNLLPWTASYRPVPMKTSPMNPERSRIAIDTKCHHSTSEITHTRPRAARS